MAPFLKKFCEDYLSIFLSTQKMFSWIRTKYDDYKTNFHYAILAVIKVYGRPTRDITAIS